MYGSALLVKVYVTLFPFQEVLPNWLPIFYPNTIIDAVSPPPTDRPSHNTHSTHLPHVRIPLILYNPSILLLFYCVCMYVYTVRNVRTCNAPSVWLKNKIIIIIENAHRDGERVLFICMYKPWCTCTCT